MLDKIIFVDQLHHLRWRSFSLVFFVKSVSFYLGWVTKSYGVGFNILGNYSYWCHDLENWRQ